MSARNAQQYIISKLFSVAKSVMVCSVFVLGGVSPVFSQSAQPKTALNLALLKAAGHNRGAEVKSLLARGADPNVKVSDVNSPANGYTPIMLLAMHRDMDISAIKALQKAGGDINALETTTGQTALMHASLLGAASEVRALLERGAKVDVAGSDGDTALTTAAQAGWDEIVRLLLDHSTRVNTQNNLGQTALLLAASGSHGPSALAQQFYKRRVRVVQMLLDHGANVNLTAKNGSSPLMAAAYHGNVEMLKAMLKKHANVTARDAKGNTALQIAIRRNQSTEVIRLLKGAGTKE